MQQRTRALTKLQAESAERFIQKLKEDTIPGEDSQNETRLPLSPEQIKKKFQKLGATPQLYPERDDQALKFRLSVLKAMQMGDADAVLKLFRMLHTVNPQYTDYRLYRLNI